MRLGIFKTIRVWVSLIFFTLVFLAFVDFGNFLPTSFSRSVLYLQFLPSLLKFISIISIAAGGFLIVFLLTALFGRVYCSSICPLGTLQDLITYFSRKLTRNKKKRRRFFDYEPAKNILRYSILIVTTLVFLIGGATLISLLDPYSNFGRFATNFAKPIIMWLNNLSARGLESMNLFWLSPIEMRDIHLTSLIFPVIMFVLVLWLAIKYGRLYCNTVCPVGTLLGFMSKYSLFQLSIDTSKCNHCGVCSNNCKSSCIDKKAQTVDFSRCVMCFDCFKSCDKDAFYFKNNWSGKKTTDQQTEEKTDLSKRGFMIGSVAIAGWLMGMKNKPTRDTVQSVKKQITSAKPTTVAPELKYYSTPPGSKSLEHFNKYCTACTLCVSACPTNVLQPTLFEYGVANIMQPRMDYWSGFCNYECKICSEVCPTGAINLIETLEEKKTIQIGKAKFVKENCVVYTDGTDCGACSEHCPTKAVDMVPYGDTGLFIPEVTEEICIGCGACEHPCPTRPFKAIYVQGNAVHQMAEKPKTEELEEKVDLEEDFPF